MRLSKKSFRFFSRSPLAPFTTTLYVVAEEGEREIFSSEPASCNLANAKSDFIYTPSILLPCCAFSAPHILAELLPKPDGSNGLSATLLKNKKAVTLASTLISLVAD